MEVFRQLVRGSLIAPCMDEEDAGNPSLKRLCAHFSVEQRASAAPEEFGMSEKTRLTKRQILRQCKAAEVSQTKPHVCLCRGGDVLSALRPGRS